MKEGIIIGNYKINMDLYGDYCSNIMKTLGTRGISQFKDNDDALYQYLNLQKKAIYPIKRKVHFANTFQYPYKHRKALNALVTKLECGVDVSPHLSRKAEDGSVFDALLYDWGIYHLHFGTEIDKQKKFIVRTNDLLFLRIDNSNAYLIGIYTHGSWSKQSMVETVHCNWPEMIERYRVNGVKHMDYGNGKTIITDQEYAVLREANISTFVQMNDGTVYMPLGLGCAASGHSAEIQLCRIYVHNSLKDIELQIRDNIDEIAEQINGNCIKAKRLNFHFALCYENNAAYIVEKNSSMKVYGPISLP